MFNTTNNKSIGFVEFLQENKIQNKLPQKYTDSEANYFYYHRIFFFFFIFLRPVHVRKYF